MSSPSTTTPPPWARPSHTLSTPRLILRSALVSDARPFSAIRSHPKNNPFGGVVNATLSEAEQAASLATQADSTAAGKNAWVNVILKPAADIEVPKEAEELKVEDGYLIGMSGFNNFRIDDEGVLVGNTGALVDWRFARKGLAMEVLEAMFEYGFNELGCGKMLLETHAVNAPFRALMKGLGLGSVEQEVKGKEGEEDEALYRFDRENWEDAKKELKEKGKWYLDDSVKP